MKRLLFATALIVFIFIFNPLVAFSNQNGSGDFKISTQDLTVQISNKGEIKEMWIGNKKIYKPLASFTEIRGAHTVGNPIIRKLKTGGIEFIRTLINDSLNTSCILTERFLPTSNSIRWKIEISGKGKSWGSSINTRFKYPLTKNTKLWATWGGPQFDDKAVDSNLFKKLVPAIRNYKDKAATYDWIDPLVPMPFTNGTFYYGAPPMDYNNPHIAFVPFQNNLICIPMCTILEENDNIGLTIALSPADNIIDMKMDTKENGSISFERLHNRISESLIVKFSLDLIAGQSDWRQSLQWMSHRYPDYFNPENPDALKFGGTGAYAGMDTSFDTQKMKKMAFAVNWQASFDFPYMGMFIPPVKPEVKWESYVDKLTSADQMNEYAGDMKKRGFYVLNYFNVTEFGTNFKFPPPSKKIIADSDLWKDCNEFLYSKFPDAMMLIPKEMNLDGCIYPKSKNGGPYYTWGDGIVTDCGDPAYRNFLLDQARRHVKDIPNAFGICIDRMDWLRFFNEKADDGISWFDGKAVRSLFVSWKQLLDKLSPIFHDANKAILVNNHVRRIDLLKHVDGIFEEFSYNSSALNTVSLLCLNKPALGWTSGKDDILRMGVDNFFQKYLYLGVYPMCPFPGNDHSIQPDLNVDKWYIDYGPLMIAMKRRKWILEPHVISVKNNLAKANLFSIPKGFYIPVVYAKKGVGNAMVTFKNVGGGKIKFCQVYSPGKKEPAIIEFTANRDNITVNVPIERSCGIVVVNK